MARANAARLASAEAERATEKDTPTAPNERLSAGLPATEAFLEVWHASEARRHLGRKLERMRRNAGLTQAELARRMGKNQAFVARMESGRGDMPKAESIALFATQCGYATAYAFVEPSGDDAGLTLHDLQPIGQSAAIAARLEAVRDIDLEERAAPAKA
jgi:transcriptional regulator with XRE-family HTH domain